MRNHATMHGRMYTCINVLKVSKILRVHILFLRPYVSFFFLFSLVKRGALTLVREMRRYRNDRCYYFYFYYQTRFRPRSRHNDVIGRNWLLILSLSLSFVFFCFLFLFFVFVLLLLLLLLLTLLFLIIIEAIHKWTSVLCTVLVFFLPVSLQGYLTHRYTRDVVLHIRMGYAIHERRGLASS